MGTFPAKTTRDSSLHNRGIALRTGNFIEFIRNPLNYNVSNERRTDSINLHWEVANLLHVFNKTQSDIEAI